MGKMAVSPPPQKKRTLPSFSFSPACFSSPNQSDILELKKRLSQVEGQLRKSEVTRKRLEVYNRKLLFFVQVMRGPATVVQFPADLQSLGVDCYWPIAVVEESLVRAGPPMRQLFLVVEGQEVPAAFPTLFSHPGLWVQKGRAE